MYTCEIFNIYLLSIIVFYLHMYNIMSGLCEDGPLSVAAHMSRLRAQLAIQANKRYMYICHMYIPVLCIPNPLYTCQLLYTWSIVYLYTCKADVHVHVHGLFTVYTYMFINTFLSSSIDAVSIFQPSDDSYWVSFVVPSPPVTRLVSPPYHDGNLPSEPGTLSTSTIST